MYLIGEILILQEKVVKEIYDEIRKLKAVIVKQENRIRALEAAQKAQESKLEELEAEAEGHSASPYRDTLDSKSGLAPDDV